MNYINKTITLAALLPIFGHSLLRVGKWLALLVPLAYSTFLPVQAQDFPTAPIRIIIPTAPGGLNDPIARFLAAHFQKVWGQPAIVEHRSGAGGTLGTHLVVKALADGHTLLLGNIGPLVFYPALTPSTPYVVKRDLIAVGSLTKFTNVLVVNPNLPVSNLAELIQLAKLKSGALNFASSGIGQSMHLAGELFNRATGVQITHVAYKGTGPALTDLIGGQVQMFFGNLPSTVPLIKSGQLRAVAVTSSQRQLSLPDVPTVIESGLPGFVVNSWCGLFAPAGTPKFVVDRINAEAAKAWATPQGQAVLAANYLDLANLSQIDFSTFVEKEIDTWSKFIKEANIRSD